MKKVKRKRCVECNKLFTPFKTTQKVCGYECSLTYLETAKKEKEKRIKEVDRWIQEKVTIDWSKKLQVKINLIIRLIDKGLPCLARGTYAKQIHAGHVYARGGNQTIRYNLHNIHRQSAQSNHYQNDDGLLREGIIKEYGQEYMDFISELRQCKALNFSNEEYKELTKKASKIASKLKKANNIYTRKERLELRNEINFELGIYEDIFCFFNIKH